MKLYQILILLSLAGFLMLATVAAQEETDFDDDLEESSPVTTTRRPRKRRTRRPAASPSVARDGPNNCTVERDMDLAQCILPGQVVGYTDFVPPKNDAELDAVCRQGFKSVGCGVKYTKECLKGVAAQITTILLQSSKNSYRSRCKSRQERKEFITALQCFENWEAAAGVHQCMEMESHKLSYLADERQLDPDMLIPAMCCSFQQFVGCARDTLKTACAASPTIPKDKIQDGADFMLDMMQEGTGEAVEVFCGKYTNLDTCQELLPVAMNNFIELEEKIKNGTAEELPYGTAIAGPIIKIFTRPDF